MPEIVDLSHVIFDGLVTYPGLPAPEVSDHLSREDAKAVYTPETQFQIGRINMVTNTGTYLDTPFHRYEGGLDLSTFPLHRLVNVPGVAIHLDVAREILVSDIEGHDVAGKAVLLHTGWDRHFGTPAYGEGHPFVPAKTAQWLIDNGAALVGIDSLNIDDTTVPTRPAHTSLLGARIPIVEHLTGLAALPTTGFSFTATPPAFSGAGTFPVRAYALVG